MTTRQDVKTRAAAQAYLYDSLSRILGLPRERNNWQLPAVYFWERDESGAYVAPSIVAFSFDPTIRWNSERQHELSFQLLQATGSDWRLVWDHLHEGFILAERNTGRLSVANAEGNRVQYIRYPTMDIVPNSPRVGLIASIWRGIRGDWDNESSESMDT